MRVSFSLTQLQYFLAVVKYKHFAHAAKACFVSQPTLSSGIKKLEQQLNVQLFERGARQEVMLTNDGEVLAVQAQKVIDEAQALEQISHKHNPLEQRFVLGAIYSVAPYLLPDLVPKLKKVAPGLTLSLEENYTERLREQLVAGHIDAAIVALPFTEAGIEVKPLYKEGFLLVVPKDHSLAGKKVIDSTDIPADELLVLGPGHCLRDQVMQACPQCANHRNGMSDTFKGSSLETIVQMVASGAGVSIIPESCASRHLHNPLLSFVSLKKPEPYRDIALVWRRSSSKRTVVDLIEGLFPL